MRLRTIRAKLAALVALPVLLMLAMLPLLFDLLHDQLVEEVDDRVTEAEHSFQIELDDDLARVRLAARLIAADPETLRALSSADVSAPKRIAETFAAVYPGVDILLADNRGHVLAEVGPSEAALDLRQIPELSHLERLSDFHGVLSNGCATALGGVPARVWMEPVGTLGVVLICERLDRTYVENAAGKLGLQLAILDGARDARPIESTEHFPAELLVGVGSKPATFDVGNRTWAAARFEPNLLAGSHGKLLAVAALDVTDVRTVVQRHLWFAVSALLFAAVISMLFGARLGGTMSRALSLVTRALREVSVKNYVSVDAPKTGDELEELALGFNDMVDGLKERDKLRDTFGKYMTETVMEHLLKGKVTLGGETLTVTILFTDIRGFTGISERMDAQSLVGLLNEYFSEMVGIVMEHDGVVDKYIGDAIMAVFGAPVPHEDDAINALRAAVGMRKALAHLNDRLRERGIPPIGTGIGIHTGEVVAGNIGSESRMEYTVIGDAVNLASRLESNTKDLGVHVLISADTYACTKHVIDARPVKEITVKGRNEPVMTYEVLGMKGEAPFV